jgi:hypothetical protein
MIDIDDVPEPVRRYRDALHAWNLAAARWLGLDPNAVTRLEIEPDDRGNIVAKWEAVEPQHPPLGYVETGGVRSDGECVAYFASVTLDHDNTGAFNTSIGPKPELLTPAERERLSRLR